MISKARAVQGFGVLLTVLSLHAHAEVYGKTGDLDVGPAADITEQTIMCSDPDVLFKMYEIRPLKGDMAKFSEEFFTPYANKGICRVVPTSSAYLIGVRTAMIKRKDKDVASKYVLARVVVGGLRGYITPITLQRNGFDIIKAVSLENEKHGAPLMQ
ncbi:hypothetical protein ACM7IS_26785 [Pseudomonas aeruginosa]|uniref:hypothetical protein n=1 Tax=Pseudomonas aeruginosa TaxID=287 RepID=UPI000F531AB8|nr:hypothetical protein [Pseudomonas aeruginosa]MBG7444455.1 hypothetical protein [Pseudomonas aeruginosa]MDU0517831.1 hypothetical protein [Pseudomonas aeruginosa]RPV10310.1 hypothetical protein IPC880_03815 [Pseudomonas aeruginosa]HBO5074394.1 hypothetical protein [Pseudomonas aeruginosa]